MRLRYAINRLLSEVQELHLTRDGKRGTMLGDVRSGRAHVATAQLHLRHALVALDRHDEPEAMRRLIRAQFAWASALKCQVSYERRARLIARPDAGGRPSREWLAERLRAHADAQDETTIIARCRAAVAADDVLRGAYGTVSDNALRRAYRGKIGR